MNNTLNITPPQRGPADPLAGIWVIPSVRIWVDRLPKIGSLDKDLLRWFSVSILQHGRPPSAVPGILWSWRHLPSIVRRNLQTQNISLIDKEKKGNSYRCNSNRAIISLFRTWYWGPMNWENYQHFGEIGENCTPFQWRKRGPWTISLTWENSSNQLTHIIIS